MRRIIVVSILMVIAVAAFVFLFQGAAPEKWMLEKAEYTIVGLGCMGFSHAYGAPTEWKEAVETIQVAYNLGYTFFDTAEVYGTEEDPHQNEVLTGEALKPLRNQVQIASFLSGKYTVQNTYSGDDVRRVITRFDKKNFAANQPLLDLLHHFADVKDATPAQISLAWMLHKKSFIVPSALFYNPFWQ